MADPAAGDTPLSRWKIWTWFRQFGSSCRVVDVRDTQRIQNSLLLDLPPEMRGFILQFVSPCDHKTLRLTCHQLHYDVENDTGVRITCSSFEQEEAEPEHNTMMSYVTTGSWFHVKQPKREACWNSQWLWLQSILVASLDLSLNSVLPLPPPEVSLLRIPFFLKTLKLRFIDEQDIRDQIVQLVNPLTGLRNVYLEYAERPRFLYSDPDVPDVHPVSRDELRDYNVTMSNFYVDILRSLYSSKSLTSLTIYVKSYDYNRLLDLSWFPLFDSYIGFPPPYQGPPIQIPSRLHMLNIQHRFPFRDVMSPYDLGNQLNIWKALLDAQTQLTSLTMRIGKVYWRYYETVMNNCRSTLKSLEISCGNWEDPRYSPGNIDHDDWLDGFYTEEVDILTPDLFNWTSLFGSNCLDSLAIYMSAKSHRSGSGTVRFCHQSFAHLKELKLYYVKLSQDDLRKVLLELPGLKNLNLQEWYIASQAQWNFTEYTAIFDQTFDYIRAAVELGRLEDIQLFGMLVSGCVYSPSALQGFQRSAIVNPGYQVTWHPECASLYEYVDQDWYYPEDPTLHIRKRL